MPHIVVHDNKTTGSFIFNSGESLLNILQAHDYSISAPCGGNGTCGKCRVSIRDVGLVNACSYYPEKDLVVVLPNRKEAQILTHQSVHTRYIPMKLTELAGLSPYPVGLGLDIGTTSVVFYWVNLVTGVLIKSRGTQNSQSKYGADVISRINYCSNNDAALKILQKEIIDLINWQIDDFVHEQGISAEHIVKISVSANTTMLHLLTGTDPTPIALVPFRAPFTEARHFRANNLSLACHPDADVYLLPSISAYVGADIVSGLAALMPPRTIHNYLFVDIGTNGEIALVSPDKIWCCAVAAGPAFEGANISCGMGAYDGAISEYSEKGYLTISDGKPVGICGSGLLDIVAFMLENGIIQSDGELADNYIIVNRQESGSGQDIVITPHDVREIQLAKSAIITGIRLLLREADLDYDQVDALYLAGGFGNYMNPASAVRVGMLPHELKEKIITVGNTSGTGAMMHVLSDDFMPYALDVVQKSELVELSSHPDFEMEFAMNMYF